MAIIPGLTSAIFILGLHAGEWVWPGVRRQRGKGVGEKSFDLVSAALQGGFKNVC